MIAKGKAENDYQSSASILQKQIWLIMSGGIDDVEHGITAERRRE